MSDEIKIGFEEADWLLIFWEINGLLESNHMGKTGRCGNILNECPLDHFDWGDDPEEIFKRQKILSKILQKFEEHKRMKKEGEKNEQ